MLLQHKRYFKMKFQNIKHFQIRTLGGCMLCNLHIFFRICPRTKGFQDIIIEFELGRMKFHCYGRVELEALPAHCHHTALVPTPPAISTQLSDGSLVPHLTSFPRSPVPLHETHNHTGGLIDT